MLKEKLTVSDQVTNQWFIDSKSMTMEALPEFLRHLTEDYEHDYSSIINAVAAGAIGAAWAMEKSPECGLTGFQASCTMWAFIANWTGKKGTMKLIEYNDMLYPQHAWKFERTISPSTWTELQEKAQQKLNMVTKAVYAPEVIEHWKHIVAGKVPFGYTVKEE